MSYRWKTVEVRTNRLEDKLNELQGAGFEIIKADLLNWEPSLQTGLYLVLARQAVSIPQVKYHVPMTAE
jgi:hypothetical protein